MKYRITTSKKYKTQFRKQSKNNQNLIDEIVSKLANGEILEAKYKDHALKGKYFGFKECHIKPDLLLVYKIVDDILELYLMQVGTHSEIFE